MNEVKESTRKSKPLMCVVTSDSMDKSRVGTVERLVKHQRYNKYIRRRTKLMFHDQNNETGVGDHVLISMCRPHSARKKFTLAEIVKKAKD